MTVKSHGPLSNYQWNNLEWNTTLFHTCSLGLGTSKANPNSVQLCHTAGRFFSGILIWCSSFLLISCPLPYCYESGNRYSNAAKHHFPLILTNRERKMCLIFLVGGKKGARIHNRQAQVGNLRPSLTLPDFLCKHRLRHFVDISWEDFSGLKIISYTLDYFHLEIKVPACSICFIYLIS